MEQDNPREKFRAFLNQIRISATQPLDIPDDQRKVYFGVTKGSIFPIFSQLASEVIKKGEPAPITAETPSFYAHGIVDKGRNEAEWLSVGMHTPIKPEPLSIGGKVIGNVTSTLHVSDGTNSVSFRTLDNNEVVFTNENREGSERVLNTPEALFDPVPSHKLYPAGNPAAWINKIVQRKILDKMEQELSVLESRR